MLGETEQLDASAGGGQSAASGIDHVKMSNLFTEMQKPPELPDFVSKKTLEELRKFVEDPPLGSGDGGLGMKLPAKWETMTVAAIVRELLTYQGLPAWDLQASHGMVAAGSTSMYPRGMPDACAAEIMRTVVKVEAAAAAAAAAAKAEVSQEISRTESGKHASTNKDNGSGSGSGSGSDSNTNTNTNTNANAEDESAWRFDGPLRKRSSGIISRWQRRYFAVTGRQLIYADDNEALMSGSTKGSLDLTVAAITRKKQFLTLTFPDAKQLELQAESEEWAVAWEEAMQEASSSGSRERKDDSMRTLSHYAPRKGTLVLGRKGSRQSMMMMPGGGASPSSPSPTAPTSPRPPSPSSPAAVGAGAGADAGAVAATAANVSQWTPQQVAEWVVSFGREYTQYHESIIDNGINGEALLDDFGDDELDVMEVEKKFHRKRILREAKKLQSR
jgi:hypothetical protein